MAAGAPGDGPKPGSGKTPNLDQYTVNLTANAKAGKIDPVLGRDFEIRQIIDILTRRRQNNPILTGEAGVGKTAIVEGFALRIAQGDVPPPLRNVIAFSLWGDRPRYTVGALRNARELQRGLFYKVIAGACTRLPLLSRLGRAGQLDRLVEASAWTDAARRRGTR